MMTLSDDLLNAIFQYQRYDELLDLRLVCRQWDMVVMLTVKRSYHLEDLMRHQSDEASLVMLKKWGPSITTVTVNDIRCLGADGYTALRLAPQLRRIELNINSCGREEIVDYEKEMVDLNQILAYFPLLTQFSIRSEIFGCNLSCLIDGLTGLTKLELRTNYKNYAMLMLQSVNAPNLTSLYISAGIGSRSISLLSELFANLTKLTWCINQDLDEGYEEHLSILTLPELPNIRYLSVVGSLIYRQIALPPPSWVPHLTTLSLKLRHLNLLNRSSNPIKCWPSIRYLHLNVHELTWHGVYAHFPNVKHLNAISDFKQMLPYFSTELTQLNYMENLVLSLDLSRHLLANLPHLTNLRSLEVNIYPAELVTLLDEVLVRLTQMHELFVILDISGEPLEDQIVALDRRLPQLTTFCINIKLPYLRTIMTYCGNCLPNLRVLDLKLWPEGDDDKVLERHLEGYNIPLPHLTTLNVSLLLPLEVNLLLLNLAPNLVELNQSYDPLLLDPVREKLIATHDSEKGPAHVVTSIPYLRAFGWPW